MANAVAFGGVVRGAVAKAAARAAGSKQYFTGKPCKHGHVSKRWVSCGSCVACQEVRKPGLQAFAKQYAADWRCKNRDKVRAYTAKWRRKNVGHGKAYMARRRALHRDLLLAQARQRYAADPERHRAKTRAFLRANKPLVAALARARRARKVAAQGTHTAAQIKTLLQQQGHRCANCLTSISDAAHADHIQPLAHGGTNWISNIQMLCPRCNMRKGAKDPIAFARQEGRLL